MGLLYELESEPSYPSVVGLPQAVEVVVREAFRYIDGHSVRTYSQVGDASFVITDSGLAGVRLPLGLCEGIGRQE